MSNIGLLGNIASSIKAQNYTDLDFMQGALPWQVNNFSRAGIGKYYDVTGLLTDAASNTPRFDYLCVTNFIRNSTCVGAIAGSPGTQPTNHSMSVRGLSSTITLDTYNGVSSIAYRIFGTPSSTGECNIAFETQNAIDASWYIQYAFSSYLALTSGNLTNVTNLSLSIDAFDDTVTYTETVSTLVLDSLISGSMKRYTTASEPTLQTTSFVQPLVKFSVTSGNAVDFTIYISCPQLENGMSARNFIPTTSSAVSETQARGLLFEGSRTNLNIRNNDFTTSPGGYTLASTTTTAGAAIGPDGTMSMTKLAASSGGSSQRYITRAISATSGQYYTLSICAKADTVRWIQFACGGSIFSATIFANFDLLTGTIHNVTSNITPFIKHLGNGIYQCSVRVQATSTTSNNGIVIYMMSGDTSTRGPSHSLSAGSGIFISNFQVEQSYFPTSLIDTVATTVTRPTDVASITNFFNMYYKNTEGTLLFVYEPQYTANSATYHNFFHLGDGTNNNRISAYRSTGATAPRYESIVSGSSVVGTNTSNNQIFNGINKIAFGWKLNDYGVCLNGGTVATDTVATIPTIDRLLLGNEYNTNNPMFSWIQKIVYFPKKLSSAELQTITALNT